MIHGSLLAGWRWLTHGEKPDVSARWLRDQEREASTRGLDGPSIKWPIRKVLNEHGQFNRERLRKRA